jgi:hypothetical protein
MQSPDQTKPSLSPPFLRLTAMTNFKSIQVPSNQNQSSPNNGESQSLDTLALQGISMRFRETSTRSSPVVSSSSHDLALA